MTVGAIIFAQNNGGIDYVKLANFAASKVKQHLGIPVSLITDSSKWLLSNFPDHNFDQVIDLPKDTNNQTKKFSDGKLSSKMLEWKNLSRNQVYNLTPYDKTLVLDSDYILNSDVLKPALDLDHDFQIYQNSFDLALGRDSVEFKTINQYSIPFFWATVFIFQKTPLTEVFFNLIDYIKSNWTYYRTLYTIESPIFRNDFAFSIAMHIISGNTTNSFSIALPGTMTYTADTDILVTAEGNSMQFLVEKKNYPGEYLMSKTSGLDVHVMNKYSLVRFIDGGCGV
jgi:hypothetical protein